MYFLIRALLIYLAIISIISFIICLYDKAASKKGKTRIPEKTLFLLSLLGGSLVMLLTMKLIRHKTRHKRFMIGIPLIIIFQISLVFAVIYLTR